MFSPIPPLLSFFSIVLCRLSSHQTLVEIDFTPVTCHTFFRTTQRLTSFRLRDLHLESDCGVPPANVKPCGHDVSAAKRWSVKCWEEGDTGRKSYKHAAVRLGELGGLCCPSLVFHHHLVSPARAVQQS